MKAWFVSDVHIQQLNERSSVKLLRFLHSIESRENSATHLFLLGDIFDLWAGDSDVFAEKFRPFVEVLDRIRRSGIEVVYFEGNHDIHIKRFWENRGIPVWDREKYFQLGPWTVRVEHGDFINPDDKAYERFRKFMRSSFMETVAYRLPGSALLALGEWSSKLSRKHSSQSRARNHDLLTKMIRTYAHRVFADYPFDYIIAGHMHIRDEIQWEAKDRKPVSINLGSWFDESKVLSLSETGHEWVSI